MLSFLVPSWPRKFCSDKELIGVETIFIPFFVLFRPLIFLSVYFPGNFVLLKRFPVRQKDVFGLRGRDKFLRTFFEASQFNFLKVSLPSSNLL